MFNSFYISCVAFCLTINLVIWLIEKNSTFKGLMVTGSIALIPFMNCIWGILMLLILPTVINENK